MHHKNVYVKTDNGRYKPFGVTYDERYLSDGLWLVRHTENCSSKKNVDYLNSFMKVGNPEYVDIPKLAGLDEYADNILQCDEFQEMLKKGYTLNELVHFIIGKIFEINKEKE